MIYSLVYISKANTDMSQEDLLRILHISREWNEEHQITGMLLYIQSKLSNHSHGRFIQALEGDKTDIIEIFDKIKFDNRHRDVTVLNQCYIAEREFKNWAMGFESIKEIDLSALPNIFELDEQFGTKDPSSIFKPALSMMKSFYGLTQTYGK
ncbi:BLUF domain-containing protein [Mucilaginibacter pallidiroseus]|uniref:BLUF domain-containing protein n=1 Tax=Mucilaginibacter pallidiroseus TaxID=2599295 RepID=A0A563U0W6_9SPHI|nr:BLUF domain-containing protein [Mucilaginibacter pallidiroseus]TWR25256.1 BLUF domain-containing protein [Mucilaginibacter pallidiroseus]